MKSFWQRQPKKNKKKERKPKTESQKQVQMKPLKPSKPQSVPWVPPHPIIPKVPSIEDISKPPMTYRISPASKKDEKPIQPSLPSEQKVLHHRDEHIRKDFLKAFRSLINRWRSWDIWTDFITMAACTISNSVDKLQSDNDNLENYWFTPMYFFPVWHYRRIWKNVDKLTGGSTNAKVHQD